MKIKLTQILFLVIVLNVYLNICVAISNEHSFLDRSKRESEDVTVSDEVTSAEVNINKDKTDDNYSTENSLNIDETSSVNNNANSENEVNKENEEEIIQPIYKPKRNKTKIDWEQVEREWKAVATDEEVKQRWENVDKKMKSGVRSILSSIFPKIVGMSTEAKVSGNCSAGILKWIISLRYLKDWSVKMLDAIGKPAPGMMEGAITMFGNYHQCLKIRAPEEEEEDSFDDEGEKTPIEFKEFFRGKYCIIEFKPWLPEKPLFYGFDTRLKAIEELGDDDSVLRDISKWAVFLNFISFRMDICVPSLCSKDDLQMVIQFLSKSLEMRGKVLRCEIEQDVYDDIQLSQIYTLMLFTILLASFGFLTVLGMFLTRVTKVKSNVTNFLRSLSWTHSWQEITDTSSHKKGFKIAPLYGVRYIVMMWIILVHSSIIVNFQFFRELMTLKETALSAGAQILTKSALQFDSLILITAFCMAFYNESNGSLKALKTVIRKYFRITPIIMVAVGIVILLPLVKNIIKGGPTWGDFVPKASERCQTNGLLNLLYMQNFLHPDEMCLPQTWLFCVEIQLALLFVPIMGLLSRHRRVSWLVLLLLIVIGFIVNVLTVYFNHLPPTLLWTIPDPEQRNFYYYVHFFKPWTHLSVFTIGIAAGHYCNERHRKKFATLEAISTIPKYQNILHILGGLMSFLVMTLLIFTYPTWVRGNLPGPLFSGVFDGLHRIFWAIAMSFLMYIITVNMEDETSLSNRILSNKFFTIMGRLTLVAYVIHPIVQIIFLSTQQSQIYSSPLLMIYGIFGNTATTYIISFLLCILFELPCSSVLTARETSFHRFENNQGEITRNQSNSTFTNNNTKFNGDIELIKGTITRY